MARSAFHCLQLQGIHLDFDHKLRAVLRPTYPPRAKTAHFAAGATFPVPPRALRGPNAGQSVAGRKNSACGSIPLPSTLNGEQFQTEMDGMVPGGMMPGRMMPGRMRAVLHPTYPSRAKTAHFAAGATSPVPPRALRDPNAGQSVAGRKESACGSIPLPSALNGEQFQAEMDGMMPGGCWKAKCHTISDAPQGKGRC